MEYRVGDKFEIEIVEILDCSERKVEEESHTLYRVKGFNSLLFDKNGLDKLQQYVPAIIEDDLKNAKREGRQEAWELAKKLILEKHKGGFSQRDKMNIFGDCSGEFILENKTYEDAKMAVTLYEGLYEIRVGDVLKHKKNENVKVIVTSLQFKNLFNGIDEYGRSFSGRYLSEFEKTNKHVDIESLLEQVRGK